MCFQYAFKIAHLRQLVVDELLESGETPAPEELRALYGLSHIDGRKVLIELEMRRNGQL